MVLECWLETQINVSSRCSSFLRHFESSWQGRCQRHELRDICHLDKSDSPAKSAEMRERTLIITRCGQPSVLQATGLTSVWDLRRMEDLSRSDKNASKVDSPHASTYVVSIVPSLYRLVFLPPDPPLCPKVPLRSFARFFAYPLPPDCAFCWTSAYFLLTYALPLSSSNRPAMNVDLLGLLLGASIPALGPLLALSSTICPIWKYSGIFLFSLLLCPLMNLFGSIALLNRRAWISLFSSLLNDSNVLRGISNHPFDTSEPCLDALFDDFVSFALGISPHLSVTPDKMGRSSGCVDT